MLGNARANASSTPATVAATGPRGPLGDAIATTLPPLGPQPAAAAPPARTTHTPLPSRRGRALEWPRARPSSTCESPGPWGKGTRRGRTGRP
eukprot:454007-Lingulodinium_polyedra.AAC.1